MVAIIITLWLVFNNTLFIKIIWSGGSNCWNETRIGRALLVVSCSVDTWDNVLQHCWDNHVARIDYIIDQKWPALDTWTIRSLHSLPSASPASLMKSEVVRGKNKTHQHHDTLNYCLNTERPITAKLGDISKYEPSAGDSQLMNPVCGDHSLKIKSFLCFV